MSLKMKPLDIRRTGPLRLLADVALILVSLYLSLWYRTDPASFAVHVQALHRWALVFVTIRIGCFVSIGVYRSLWRYISVPDVFRLARAVAVSVPLLISATYVFPKIGYLPRSLFFIDGFVSLALLTAARLVRRRCHEWSQRGKQRPSPHRILIYGAGLNGRTLAQQILNNLDSSVQIVGFVDDDPGKQGMTIGGIEVLGGGHDLEEILQRTLPSNLVVAMKEPPAELLTRILLAGRTHGFRPKVLSGFETDGVPPERVSLYRDLDLRDLLRRPISKIDVTSVRSVIQGKVVLVTGAGGSIGAELARQIARFDPAKLLALDQCEFNLYEIDRELRPTSSIDRIVPLLLDVRDRNGLDELFRRERPEVIFHAAAYKHVHLVEANPIPAILNNVLGTKNLLELCEEYGVERFLLISSDKAVNPGGVMGATKRLCEVLTSEAALRLNRPYSSVRFGNVLGSSGSVVPLLKSQIESGGPVTITHPDMTRYFMLIPEAVSLSLMSSFLAQPGDIGVLSMGKPVRIVDLARNLMVILGKSENEIPIAFTGVRPGEKISEDLYLTGDEVKTLHPDILTVPAGDLGEAVRGWAGQRLVVRIDRLIALAQSYDERCMHDLQELVRTLGRRAALRPVVARKA